MSANFTNLVSLINSNTKANDSSYPIAEKVIDMNLAMDKAFYLIFKSDGKWQFDDSNHTDYPIITTNLVSGQRDYSFTSDESGNLILDIYKVVVMGEDGIYKEVYPVDQQSGEGMQGFFDGQNTTGTPLQYDKTANGIFLKDIPGYNATNGLKIYINREGSYFTVSDTTKKPGFDGLCHEYIALRPSYMYAMRNGLTNMNLLKQEMLEMEQTIQVRYSNRSKDEKTTLSAKIRNYE